MTKEKAKAFLDNKTGRILYYEPEKDAYRSIFGTPVFESQKGTICKCDCSCVCRCDCNCISECGPEPVCFCDCV